uniref:HNHc domain-containing protein n=1 Tax=Panagrellus redivivus TaxID=6233 RepID=A0A7E4ZXD5_PANRE
MVCRGARVVGRSSKFACDHIVPLFAYKRRFLVPLLRIVIPLLPRSAPATLVCSPLNPSILHRPFFIDAMTRPRQQRSEANPPVPAGVPNHQQRHVGGWSKHDW